MFALRARHALRSPSGRSCCRHLAAVPRSPAARRCCDQREQTSAPTSSSRNATQVRQAMRPATSEIPEVLLSAPARVRRQADRHVGRSGAVADAGPHRRGDPRVECSDRCSRATAARPAGCGDSSTGSPSSPSACRCPGPTARRTSRSCRSATSRTTCARLALDRSSAPALLTTAAARCSAVWVGEPGAPAARRPSRRRREAIAGGQPRHPPRGARRPRPHRAGRLVQRHGRRPCRTASSATPASPPTSATSCARR